MSIFLTQGLVAAIKTPWDHVTIAGNCFAWGDKLGNSHWITAKEAVSSIALPILAGIEIAALIISLSASLVLPIAFGITATLVAFFVLTTHFKATSRHEYLYKDFIKMCDSGTEDAIIKRISEGATGLEKPRKGTSNVDNAALRWTCLRKMDKATSQLLVVDPRGIYPIAGKASLLEEALLTNTAYISRKQLRVSLAKVLIEKMKAANLPIGVKAFVIALKNQDYRIADNMLENLVNPFEETSEYKVSHLLDLLTKEKYELEDSSYIWNLLENPKFIAHMKSKYEKVIDFEGMEKALKGKALKLAYLLKMLDQQPVYDPNPIIRLYESYSPQTVDNNSEERKKVSAPQQIEKSENRDKESKEFEEAFQQLRAAGYVSADAENALKPSE